MVALYSDKNEYQQHAEAIHKLASQFHAQESQVRDLYEKILSDLLETARFKKYLLILVSRRVKDILHRTRTG